MNQTDMTNNSIRSYKLNHIITSLSILLSEDCGP